MASVNAESTYVFFRRYAASTQGNGGIAVYRPRTNSDAASLWADSSIYAHRTVFASDGIAAPITLPDPGSAWQYQKVDMTTGALSTGLWTTSRQDTIWPMDGQIYQLVSAGAATPSGPSQPPSPASILRWPWR